MMKLIFLWSLVFANEVPNSEDSRWEEFERSLPTCARLGSKSDENASVAGLLITRGGNLSDSEISKAALAALEGQPKTPPQIFIFSRDSSTLIPDIQKKIDVLDIDEATKKIWRSALTGVVSDGEPAAWNQDYLHTKVGPGDGRARLYYLEKYDATKSGNFNSNSQYKRFLLSSSQFNNFNRHNFQEMEALQVNDLHAGHYGGNLLSLPDGSCVIGLSRFKDDATAESFAKSICGKDAPVLVVDTSWLSVSHADEILSYISDKDGNKSLCTTQFLMPSPSAAKKLMQMHPKRKFLSAEGLPDGFRSNIDHMFNSMPLFKEVCLRKYKKISTKCLDVTNEDILQLSSPSELDLNDKADEKLKKAKSDFVKFVEKNNKCSPKVVEIPSLFTGGMIEGKLALGKTLTGNPVNLVNIGNKSLVPLTGNSVFDSEIKKIFAKNAKEAIPLNTFKANVNGGNAHCMIKAIRRCRPTYGTAPENNKEVSR